MKNILNYKPWLFLFFLILIVLTLFPHSYAFSQQDQILQYSAASKSAGPPEIELGKKIFKELKKQLTFSDNPLMQAYINKIGEKILEQVPPNRFTFRFFIIKSDQLNAFALPNGYICFTERLLSSVNSEDELAFVLCHETAHVTQTHFRRLMSRKSKVDIATMAAMVAGLLLAKDINLQTAIPAFSLGTNQSFLLKYSREFEDEADEVGFNYLVKAGYQAKGAIAFMNKLSGLERLSITPPAYLSTHPPTNSRLYHLEKLKERAKGLSPSLKADNDQFRKFQIWTRLESKNNLQDFLENLEKGYEKDPNDSINPYGLALVYEKIGQVEKSSTYFEKGLAIDPDNLDILRDFGIFLFRRGEYLKAEKPLKKVILNSQDFLGLHYLGRVLEKMNKINEAINYLQQSKSLNPDYSNNYFVLGLLYQKKGQESESHQNFGKHFSLQGNGRAAKFHFKEAERLKKIQSKESKDS